VYSLPFRLDNEKIIIRAVSVTGRDFTVDTGWNCHDFAHDGQAERHADHLHLSAGVGEVGLRGLQLGRIDKLEIGPLKVKQVPCIIKSPALQDLPMPEGESFSPLAMGLSVRVDYARRVMTFEAMPDDGPAT
jgi:hypothetical protein